MRRNSLECTRQSVTRRFIGSTSEADPGTADTARVEVPHGLTDHRVEDVRIDLFQERPVDPAGFPKQIEMGG